MKKLLAPAATISLLLAFGLTGCSSSTTDGTDSSAPAPATSAVAETEAPDEETPAGDSFVDGVLTTDDVTIKITDSRVIPAGEVGNEYGEVPVLAIWYDTTNLGTSDRDITPMEFLYNFEAFQDNDPNIENRLEVGMLPDEAFLDTQLENIKAGGTLANAVSYELTDTTTPVDLVAGGMVGDEIGRTTIELG